MRLSHSLEPAENTLLGLVPLSWRACWAAPLSYGHRVGNGWLYLNCKVQLFCVPLDFRLIEKNFLFEMFVCHSFSFTPFSCSFSCFLQTWSHSIIFDVRVSILPEAGLSACYRWGKTGDADGRKQIRVVRGKYRELHTTELLGKCKDQRQLSWGGERTFFPGFSKIIQNVCVTSSAQQKLYCWFKNPWRCSGHILLLLLFTPSATADPLDWSQDYRISKSWNMHSLSATLH